MQQAISQQQPGTTTTSTGTGLGLGGGGRGGAWPRAGRGCVRAYYIGGTPTTPLLNSEGVAEKGRLLWRPAPV